MSSLVFPSRKVGKEIDFLATQPHYLDHIASVYLALGKTKPEQQGKIFLPAELFPRAKKLGIARPRVLNDAKKQGLRNITYTSAYGDMKFSRNQGRPTILTEHGCGQSFLGVRSQSYLNSPDRAGVIAIFTPSTYPARFVRETHPAIPVYRIGVPKLDHRHLDKSVPREARGVVAFSWHWDSKVAPETRTALRHYRSALPEIAKKHPVLGHAHPLIARQLRNLYAKYNIEFIQDFDELIDRAELYVCDASSTIMEWASLDRPVICLNAPWYRRDVEHGMLFWSHRDVGIQVDHSRDLEGAIRQALVDPPEIRERRAKIIRDIYGKTDGKASDRAVRALLDVWKKNQGSA